MLAGAGAAASVAPGMTGQIAAQNSIGGVTWISTTAASRWQQKPLRGPGWQWDTLDARVATEATGPVLAGFGACFNELGWTALNALDSSNRDAIFKELFEPGFGASFNLCRMPLGANDFSRGWYSYDEHDGDFALDHFSIANDLETLVPFIKQAQQYSPDLELWASPWSPPSWMKRNKHYAAAMQFIPGQPPNGLTPDRVGKEGTDLFIQDEKYFQAYALYFGRFIDAYREQGIRVGMVMPQNEFNSAQPFPSCTWTPEGLARFVRHLGPEMAKRDVEVFFGTLERANESLLNVVLADQDAGRYIKGVGVQWAGKGAIAQIHRDHPALTLYQSEQECGDGKNTWAYAGYCWDLMKHYLRSGASGYMYWNIALVPGGESHWGWPQNSLITVTPQAKTYAFNHEYYVMKHVSHFVQKGAQRLEVTGTEDNALAFLNPDKSLAVILRNESAYERPVNVAIGERTIAGSMEPDSFNTLLVREA
ncbi:glycosyl hydrolase [Edaphobacter acidisoli]|uniref:Glycosyl hydrolase n=2 Tax=Edaphobacter acidisoli TaxID=2040573 RepID=A0A916W7K9_9BACT|nr:glycosyl hydrolase [Edaphobacter acidisoli]